MKLQELASLMNISKEELIEQLKQSDVIELKLNDLLPRPKGRGIYARA